MRGGGGGPASAPALLAPVRVPFVGGEGTRRPTRVCLRGKTHPLRAARVGRAVPARQRLGCGWMWMACADARGGHGRIRARPSRPRSHPVRWRRRDSPPYPRARARKSPSPARSTGRASTPCEPGGECGRGKRGSLGELAPPRADGTGRLRFQRGFQAFADFAAFARESGTPPRLLASLSPRLCVGPVTSRFFLLHSSSRSV